MKQGVCRCVKLGAPIPPPQGIQMGSPGLCLQKGETASRVVGACRGTHPALPLAAVFHHHKHSPGLLPASVRWGNTCFSRLS